MTDLDRQIAELKGWSHVLNFRIRNGRIQFQPRRDNRATGQRRRKKIN